eukprot:c24952_g2_i1 orf=28-1200(-)
MASKPPLESLLRMQRGSGENSYASFVRCIPNDFNQSFWPLLSDSISQHLPLPVNQTTLRIADLGCASGANSISTMDYVVGALRHLYASRALPQPEVQAFFGDLPGNDFNTLFSTLCSLPQRGRNGVPLEETGAARNYFAAGVPGSFYKRLFPQSSLHVVYSISSLHFLSKVPEEVENQHSPAWNEGKTWIDEGSKAATVEAYAKQFQQDFLDFLRCRQFELVPGGLLFLIMAAQPGQDDIPHSPQHINQFSLLEAAWDSLISEGSLDAKSKDAFNLPFYAPRKEELVQAVEASQAFQMEALEVRNEEPWPEAAWDALRGDAQAWRKAFASMLRNSVGSLLEAHLGEEQAEMVMGRVEEVAAMERESEVACTPMAMLRNVLVLTHKGPLSC